MPSRLHQMRRIVAALDERLRAAYPSGTQPSPDGGDPLVNAFTEFGIRAGEASMTTRRHHGRQSGSAPGTLRAFRGLGKRLRQRCVSAGVAAAATAQGYLSANAPEVEVQEPEPQPVPRQLARLAALHQINRAATANLKLAQMLDTVVDVVAQPPGAMPARSSCTTTRPVS